MIQRMGAYGIPELPPLPEPVVTELGRRQDVGTLWMVAGAAVLLLLVLGGRK